MINRKFVEGFLPSNRLISQLNCFYPLVSEPLLNSQKKRSFFGSRSSHIVKIVRSDTTRLRQRPPFSDTTRLRQRPPFSFLETQFFNSTISSHILKTLNPEKNPSAESQTAIRISRVARTEAQDAVFDYLHCTRSLAPTDAEHVSKNCPNFLQNLLTKVGTEQDIRHSLTRFLRYNPINEFEPFFESLGLKPSEIYPLLPRDLIFLSDDEILIENIHVLCNYGIPRIKIGKMYKEEMEIFRYDYGLLGLKLRGYENLGLSKPTVIELVTCCPSLLVGSVDGGFVQVLDELKGLGIERNSIRGYLSNKSMSDWNKMVGVFGFLEKMGCGKKDLGRLIRKRPRLFFNDSGRKIYILIALLLKLGLEKKKILWLFLQYPQILAGNFAKNLWQAINFLSQIGMETKDIANIVQTHPHVLGLCSLKRPERVLKDMNVGCERLHDIIKEDPNQLINVATRSNISRLEQFTNEDQRHPIEKTTFLMKLGFLENSDEMIKGLKQFRGRGDQLQERFDCLVNAGLDYNDVINMIRGSPPVLNQCKDVIKKKIDHLVNHLGFPLQSVVAFPTYLCYDIERIKLRFSMYSWLKEKGVVKPNMALSTILACSDARFVKYHVSLHPEGVEVWENLKRASSSC